jgi:hypothetical protein
MVTYREEAAKPLAECKLMPVANILTPNLRTRITSRLVTRRTGNYTLRTITRLITRRDIPNKLLETGKKVTRLVVAARIYGFARIAITCKNPNSHQKGDDQGCHHNSEFH